MSKNGVATAKPLNYRLYPKIACTTGFFPLAEADHVKKASSLIFSEIVET